MTEAPASQRKRIVLCRGEYCNLSRRADNLYKTLETLLVEINGGEYPPRVKLETANCLNMCGAGPNLILYPDGIICNQVDEAMVREMVEKHLSGA